MRKTHLKSQIKNHNQVNKPIPMNNPDSIQTGIPKKKVGRQKNTQETVNGNPQEGTTKL